MSSKSQLIRTIYLYAVSLITLVMIIIAASNLINLGLKTWVFTKADRPDYFEPGCPVMAPIGKNETAATSTQESCDEYKKNQQENYKFNKQSQAINSFSMFLVAAPLFFFHWRLAKKDKEEKEN